MKKNYTDEEMLKIIQEVEAEFSNALAKAEAKENTEDASSENLEQEIEGLYASMEKSEAESHLKALSKVLNVSSLSKSEGEELLKSEIAQIKSSNEELSKANEELKKNLEKAISVIAKTVKPSQAPARKAIVSEVEYIQKSEQENTQKDVTKLSKSEISAKLTEQIRSGKLAKKDQDLIVKFYENKNPETIKHLL
jgi:phage-related protein